MMARSVLCVVILWATMGGCTSQRRGTGPLTVAEESAWQATARHQDVIHMMKELAAGDSLARLVSMGTSFEGRDIPLLVLADPPLDTPEAARRSGKLVFYAQGGIHSGECCGKEALLMMARDLLSGSDRALLKNAVVLIAPIYNPDGNERVSPDNRPGQAGPVLGMGKRETAQGYDLNRDNIKLDSPEAQALSRLLIEWDPFVFVDTHTTNGSYHQYTLTYDGPVNPAGDPTVIKFMRERFLPEIGRAVEERTGYRSNFYGNYNRDKTRWTTYDGRPRFGTRARGIRGVLSILTEAYKYASFRDRVLCTKAFCEEALRFAVLHREDITQLVRDCRQRAVARGRTLDASDLVSIRAAVSRLPQDIHLDGWVEVVPEGSDPKRTRPHPTDEKRTYVMEHWGGYTSTLDVVRPLAYVFPRSMKSLAEKLQQHGVIMHEIGRGKELELEVFKVETVERAKRAYQGHHRVKLKGRTSILKRPLEKDSYVVPLSQPLGQLIVYMLEPLSEDGLVSWGLLGDDLKEGREYPVHRVIGSLPALSSH